MGYQQGKKTIVISAVNLNEAGTLTILRDCLGYLSAQAKDGHYRVVALVHKRELADFPNIEYIETQWPKKRWVNRLWYEYVSMDAISKELGEVYLWFSLHDTTPNVRAERQAVYCHNPFPFYRWKWREWFFTPKIVLFALFSKFIYQKNIKRNRYVVVQQQWIREAFVRMFSLDLKQIVVALPDPPALEEVSRYATTDHTYRFVYAASPNSHKNFECLAAAAALLEQRGTRGFQVSITVKGTENAYAQWLHKRWGDVAALDFVGFMDRKTLFGYYADADCLVFPSKVETWGLPITEFGAFNKPMLLADLPYAKETAAGFDRVAFFDPDQPEILADQMQKLMKGQQDFLSPVPKQEMEAPVSTNWESLFAILLS